MPSAVWFSSVIGYADDHTLLKIIRQKQDRLRAADELNTDLEALFQFGQQWFMDFAPLKIKALLISLKRDTLDHPTLFINNCPIAEVSLLKILGLTLLLHGGLYRYDCFKDKAEVGSVMSSIFLLGSCWFICYVQVFCPLPFGVRSPSLLWRH